MDRRVQTISGLQSWNDTILSSRGCAGKVEVCGIMIALDFCWLVRRCFACVWERHYCMNRTLGLQV